MTIKQHKPAPLPENQVISVAPSDDLITIKMLVAETDRLVLSANNHLGPQLIDIFTVDSIQHSPDLKWTVTNRAQQFFQASESPINCRTGVYMKIPVPVLIERTRRGYKTNIEVTFPKNYSIHEETFLKYKRPKIYAQLGLNE